MALTMTPARRMVVPGGAGAGVAGDAVDEEGGAEAAEERGAGDEGGAGEAGDGGAEGDGEGGAERGAAGDAEEVGLGERVPEEGLEGAADEGEAAAGDRGERDAREADLEEDGAVEARGVGEGAGEVDGLGAEGDGDRHGGEDRGGCAEAEEQPRSRVGGRSLRRERQLQAPGPGGEEGGGGAFESECCSLRSWMRRRPVSVRSSSTTSMASVCGAMRRARPPVATTRQG